MLLILFFTIYIVIEKKEKNLIETNGILSRSIFFSEIRNLHCEHYYEKHETTVFFKKKNNTDVNIFCK